MNTKNLSKTVAVNRVLEDHPTMLSKKKYVVPEDKIVQHISLDFVIFGIRDRSLEILTVKRNLEPNFGMWALPGGLIFQDESLEKAAKRSLEELTGVKGIYLEQLQAFGEINRYPGKRVITIAYTALINAAKFKLQPGESATEVRWTPVRPVPHMAFDHTTIARTALMDLQHRVMIEPVGFELLPKKFTLTELQNMYEVILDTQLDKRNFRKRMLHLDLVEKLDEKQEGVTHRAANYYRFNKKQYELLKDRGFQLI